MIIATFEAGQTKTYTRTAYQFDKGQRLIVTGIALPSSFEVHVSNDKDGGLATNLVGSAEGVIIPDAYFTSGENVYVWIYAKDQEIVSASSLGYQMSDADESSSDEVTVESGTTVYTIVIPITRRAQPVAVPAIQMSGVAGYYVNEDNVLVPVRQ